MVATSTEPSAALEAATSTSSASSISMPPRAVEISAVVMEAGSSFSGRTPRAIRAIRLYLPTGTLPPHRAMDFALSRVSQPVTSVSVVLPLTRHSLFASRLTMEPSTTRPSVSSRVVT